LPTPVLYACGTRDFFKCFSDGKSPTHASSKVTNAKNVGFHNVIGGDSDDDFSDNVLSDHKIKSKVQRKKTFLPEYKKLLVS